MRPDRFNIRVYALILDRQEKNILISDERVAGLEFSKFPGGGLEFGEGVMDCIHREAIEELGQEIEVKINLRHPFADHATAASQVAHALLLLLEQ
jgi:ADP-ribose pyrophosphatase YjhB (NUDIX family)